MSNKLLPLALLYVDGRREIDGATKFQKLVFLAQKETDIEESFEFRSDKYGPFSPELHATLDELENRNLIRKEIRRNRSGNEKYTYSLTGYGTEVLQKVMDKDEGGDFEQILENSDEVKKEYNRKPFDRLLRYVYSKYDEYTDKSELEEYKR